MSCLGIEESSPKGLILARGRLMPPAQPLSWLLRYPLNRYTLSGRNALGCESRDRLQRASL